MLLGAGVVENCTVVGNVDSGKDRNPAVGVGKVAIGTVRNCIVAANTNLDGPAGVGGTYGAANTTYTLCDVAGLAGAGCKTGDPLFKKPADGDYRLSGTSPALKAGLVQPWMSTAADLDGAPRLYRGRFVDMGCYQNQKSGATMLYLR